MKGDLLKRFQKWFVIAIAAGVFLYFFGSVWVGVDKIQGALKEFQWWAFVVAIVLTLSNYALRFFKWHYLCRRLDIDIDMKSNAWIFVAGLSMAISPAKAGELLKPYALREKTGTPMAHSIPALITERLTDGIAMLILAATGVTSYAAGQVYYLLVPAVLTLLGLAVLAHEGLSLKIIALLSKLPVLSKISEKLQELYRAMRQCLAPISLFWTILLSLIAWAAECVAFQIIFQGMGIDAPFGVCFFVYAFATVAGSAMPGGLGIADGALVGGAQKLIKGITTEQAMLASILTRIATMWFGVALGAFALVKVASMLGGTIDIDKNKE